MKKKKNILKYILTGAAIVFALACEKTTVWNLQSSGPVIIVDAILTSELKNQEVKIYYSSADLNIGPKAISGADIKVISTDDEYYFFESDSISGTYLSDIPFRCAIDIVYQLIVTTEEIKDTASAKMIAITPLQAYDIVPYDTLYRFVYYDDNTPSFTEVFYNWSAIPEYCDSAGHNTASETFYTLNNLDVNKIFAPKKQKIGFPEGTQIIRKKYSLQAYHQEFIRSMLMETEWRGGIFDVEQGNVITNFNHGIKGWFGVCMVLSDTIDFNTKY